MGNVHIHHEVSKNHFSANSSAYEKPVMGEKSKSAVGAQRWLHWWTSTDYNNLVLLTLLGLVVRLFVLYNPSVVIFDEVHFGGFASNYLNRNYYLDVHPPLAKLLIALSGWICNLESSFRFDQIGIDYVDANVPYIFMRLIPALLGSFMIPLSYIIMRNFGVSRLGSCWTSSLIIFENSFITQFRLILLDSYLVFGTCLCVTFYSLFRSYSGEAFDKVWWTYLIGLGTSLGFTLSCKWVGLFTLAGIGIFVALELWDLLGNTELQLSRLSQHFWARFVCLLALPFVIYMGTFWIHFQVLSKYGISGGTMSIEFQQDLEGGTSAPIPEDVGYGSTITLRHYESKNGYLHSHNHVWPAGSKQQQVTLYSFPDPNNYWRLIPARQAREAFNDTHYLHNPLLDEKLIPLRHGDVVRLVHLSTGRFLHSHPVEAPITTNKEHFFEVSAYGSYDQNVGDGNDNWAVQITDRWGNPLEMTALEWNEKSEDLASVHYLFEKTSPSAEDLQKEFQEQLHHDEAVPDSDVPIESLTEAKSPILKQPPKGLSEEEKKDYPVFPTIKARTTYFRLYHPNTACFLCSFGKKLPAWGFEQFEVVCGRDARKRNTVWVIDQNTHSLIADPSANPDEVKVETTNKIVSKVTNYGRLTFWEKFLELNKLMWTVNAGLTESHYFGSRPGSWFTLSRGIGFWNGHGQGARRNVSMVDEDEYRRIQIEERLALARQMAAIQGIAPDTVSEKDIQIPIEEPYRDAMGQRAKRPVWKPGSYVESPELKERHKDQQIYLLGNPVLWWSVSLTIVLYVFFIAVLFLRTHRGIKDDVKEKSKVRVTNIAGFLLTGWAIHYFPFWAMKRQLFLHHYLPAYFFGILLFGLLTDHILSSLALLGHLSFYRSQFTIPPQKHIKWIIYGCFFAMVFGAYWLFSPLTYGLKMTKEQCLSLKWLASWDFDCEHTLSALKPSFT